MKYTLRTYAACIGRLLAGRGDKLVLAGEEQMRYGHIDVKQKKQIRDDTPQIQGHALVGLSGGIICSNRQQRAHAIKYVIWALLNASTTRER
jgi:hypothetical protein